MLSTFIFTETSPASATTSTSSAPVSSAASYLPAGVAGPLDDATSVDVFASLVGATGGTLDVYLQVSPDEGQTWWDAVHFTQLAAGAAAVSYRVPLSAHGPATSDAPVTVGQGTSPALAAGAFVRGLGFNRARLVMVAGSGTTKGATVKVTLAAQRTARVAA